MNFTNKMSYSLRSGLCDRRTEGDVDGACSEVGHGSDGGTVQIHLHGCETLHRHHLAMYAGGTGE